MDHICRPYARRSVLGDEDHGILLFVDSSGPDKAD